MVKFEIDLLIALVAFCVLTLVVFLELGLTLGQIFIDSLGKLISAHWTCNSNI